MTDQLVTSKIDIQTLPPLDDDLWADFRQIERITLEFTQAYKHSLGKYSRFFIELENQRFFATHCAYCGKTYAPPRPLCPDCMRITAWTELKGTGTLETYAVQHFSPNSNADVRGLATPYILAYVLLDGASTLFPHLLNADPASVKIGMRVQVAYVTHPVSHPIHLMYFERQKE